MSVQKLLVPLQPQISKVVFAQMAESVDALVSNTSGAIHPGSIPGLGTKMERSFTSLLFSYTYLSIYTHLSLHIYPLTSYHIPHSTETENTGSHQKVHWRQTRQHLASAISTSRMWLSTTRHTRRLMKRVSPSISNIALMIKDRLDILHICLKKREGGKYLSMAFTSFSFIIINRKTDFVLN